MDQLRFAAELGRAHDRVVEEAGGDEGAVGLVDGLLEERVAEPVGVAAVQLALEQQRVDGASRVVGDDVAEHVHAPRLHVDAQQRGVAGARPGLDAPGVPGLGGLDPVGTHQLGQGHAAAGDSPHRHSLRAQLQVRGIRLQEVRRPVEQRPPGAGRGERHRVAELQRAPAARGDRRERHLPAVAEPDLDPLRVPAQAVGDHLGDKGLVTLALGSAPHDRDHGGVGKDAHARRLGHRDPRRLHAHRQAEAERLACRLPPADLGYADPLGRQVEQARVVSAIVDLGRVAGVVGHVRGLEQVPAPKLGRLDPQPPREPVHHPLDPEVAHRAPAAADVRCRRPGREPPLDVQPQRR